MACSGRQTTPPLTDALGQPDERVFPVDWAFGVRGAVESIVRTRFSGDLRSWPLLQAFDLEAYELPHNYMATTWP